MEIDKQAQKMLADGIGLFLLLAGLSLVIKACAGG